MVRQRTVERAWAGQHRCSKPVIVDKAMPKQILSPSSSLTAAANDPMPINWPPLLVIHGDADAVVSPQNGRAAVQAWADAGLARAGNPRSVQPGKRYGMQLTDYVRRGRTVVTLATVRGLPHAWSGGTAGQPFSDARSPDASRMAWAFAAKQFQS